MKKIPSNYWSPKFKFWCFVNISKTLNLSDIYTYIYTVFSILHQIFRKPVHWNKRVKNTFSLSCDEKSTAPILILNSCSIQNTTTRYIEGKTPPYLLSFYFLKIRSCQNEKIRMGLDSVITIVVYHGHCDWLWV